MIDPRYAQVVTEKRPFLVPADLERSERSLRSPNLLDGFVACLDAADQHWFQQNGSVFVELLDAVAEGARHHHDEIVAKFISDPSGEHRGRTP